MNELIVLLRDSDFWWGFILWNLILGIFSLFAVKIVVDSQISQIHSSNTYHKASIYSKTEGEALGEGLK